MTITQVLHLLAEAVPMRWRIGVGNAHEQEVIIMVRSVPANTLFSP